MFENAAASFVRLLGIMDELREKCPWDKKQTMESLRNLTVEETYELADAIDKRDMKGIKEEIGDLILHLVFYSKIADEQKHFNISEAIEAVCDKLIHRHPHIYGDIVVENEAEVKRNWEQLKLKEGKKSILEGVPDALPALVKAYRMQEKTKQVGFEWENTAQVWEKVQEEIAELQVCLDEKATPSRLEDEFGDVLFSLVNFARFIGVDPETALARTNQKFKRRFEFIETHAPKQLQDMSLTELDELWVQAKQLEK